MENHHVVPISISGWDVIENQFLVSISDHKLIHSTLNIPYSNIRKFRRLTNHVLVPNIVYMEQLEYVQRLYFEGIEKLPVILYDKHVRSMRMLANLACHWYDHKVKCSPTFWDYFNAYHQAQRKYVNSLH